MDGALLIHKDPDLSSFGVIENLQRILSEKLGVRKRDLPKMGHGGTLDPFATGLLVVLVGRGVKLARYFLGSTKVYEGVVRFGETSTSGDLTGPISETTDQLPSSLDQLREVAHKLTLQAYLQVPPMHSAKKMNGRPLYELARAGLEIEREPKLCYLYEFDVNSFHPPCAEIKVKCSSGTYIRTLAQDFARLMGSVALLEKLHRTSSGAFDCSKAWKLDQIREATQEGKDWSELPCWISFDQLLKGFSRAEATEDEHQALIQGKQNVLPSIIKRVRCESQKTLESNESGKDQYVAIYRDESLVAVARKEQELWSLERVFTEKK
jgi:tRNA pseudouridine55 synthase